MGRLIAEQPNGKYALISTCTDSFAAVDCTKEEVMEEIVGRQLKRCKEDLARLLEMQANLFTDKERFSDWKKAVQWHHYRQAKDNRETDELWQYIKKNIDPTIDEMVAEMNINEEGEWVN